MRIKKENTENAKIPNRKRVRFETADDNKPLSERYKRYKERNVQSYKNDEQKKEGLFNLEFPNSLIEYNYNKNARILDANITWQEKYLNSDKDGKAK
jgi:hypothetical protein